MKKQLARKEQLYYLNLAQTCTDPESLIASPPPWEFARSHCARQFFSSPEVAENFIRTMNARFGPRYYMLAECGVCGHVHVSDRWPES